jgi:peptidyl-prolyl cis-trans isomerase SurA
MSVIISIISLFLSITSAHAEVVEKILVIVNDDIVTQSDLDRLATNLKSDGLVDKALLELYDKKRLLSDKDYQLEFLIDERLLDAEIRRQGIVSPIEKVEAEIRKIISDNKTSREQLRTSLTKRGLSYAEYQNFVKGSLERQTLLSREVASRIKVSDDEVAAFFIQNSKSNKPLVYEYDLAHILFLKKGSPDDDRARAEQVRSKVVLTGNFDGLAAQYSEDPHFSQGGLFGNVKAGEVAPALERALQGLQPGDITQVVDMPDGYHIFKILKRTLVPSPELNAARPRIQEILFTQGFSRQYRSYIEQRRLASYIRINN